MKTTFLCLCFVMVLGYSGCKETYIYGPETLVDPSIKPMVIYTYPAPNSRGPYDPLNIDQYESEGFVVRFNKLMDAASVKRSISISSNRRSISTDSSRISGSGENYKVLPAGIGVFGDGIFSTSVTGEELTLTVATTALDVNGNHLSREYKLKCVPEPRLRLKRIFPENRIIDNYGWAGSTVFLEFTSRIDHQDLGKLQWSPPVSGSWNEYGGNSSSLHFSFDTQLLPDTIHLLIPSTVRDDSGNTLLNGQSVAFSHANFRVVSQSPYGEAPLDASFEIRFSRALDTTTMSRAFSLRPAIPGQLSLDSTHSVITFDPPGDLDPQTSYVVTIDTSIRSVFGDRLSESARFYFRTNAFRVSSSSPAFGESNVRRNGPISISFTNPIDTATVRSAFSILPAVSGNIEFSGSPMSGFIFRPDQLLPPSAICSVMVSTDMRTPGGTALPLAWMAIFRTRD